MFNTKKQGEMIVYESLLSLVRRHAFSAVLALLVLLGAWHIASSAYIYIKSTLAQYLLVRAWHTSIYTGDNIKPWFWADTWPVAKLAVPSLEVELIVLAGDSGRTLAFGPGHRFGSAAPGQVGNSVISGHRDSHFKFLRNLDLGAVIHLQMKDNSYRHYEVVDTAVVDEHATWLPDSEHDALLTLVTCYPFDAVTPGGRLRYLVLAQAL